MTNLSVRSAALLAAIAASTALSACAPIIVGGAMLGGTMMVTDRRTSGAQVEDEAIELKAMNRIRDVLHDRGHASTVSYNRMVLIIGEVPTEEDKAAVEQAVQRVENARSTVNEVAVMGTPSLTSRSNDAILTSKVKASLIDAKDLQAQAFKVVTERGIVYMMGRVTEREATRGVDIARGVSGVQKVVRVFEMVTEQELADTVPKPAAK